MALDFVAGCLGGCAGVLAGHPFDTIKVHLQTQDAARPLYKGTFHCIQTIVQKESVLGLYRGMSSPLCGVALINAIVFGVHGNVQRHLGESESLLSHFCAGGAAGLAQSVVCSPIELAKTRMQVQAPRAGAGGAGGAGGVGGAARGPLQCLLLVGRQEGVRGVWRGLGATAARDAGGIAVYFAAYEWLSRAAAPAPDQPLSTGRVLLCGGLAGCASWMSSFPVDVIKSRLQVDGIDGARRYSGFWDCWRQSARAEGLSFLGRGLSCTLLRAFFVNAATFAVVTWVLRLAGADAPLSARTDVEAPMLQSGAPLLLGALEPLHAGLQARQQQLRNLVHGRPAPDGLAACFQANLAIGRQEHGVDTRARGRHACLQEAAAATGGGSGRDTHSPCFPRTAELDEERRRDERSNASREYNTADGDEHYNGRTNDFQANAAVDEDALEYGGVGAACHMTQAMSRKEQVHKRTTAGSRSHAHQPPARLPAYEALGVDEAARGLCPAAESSAPSSPVGAAEGALFALRGANESAPAAAAAERPFHVPSSAPMTTRTLLHERD